MSTEIVNMAAVLRHWREASTLIIVTARQKGSQIKPHSVSSSGTSVSTHRGKNLEVLLLKRSPSSKFMPNAYVYPGGVADDVDFSADWISVFDFLGKDHRQRVFDFAQRGGQGAPMFSRVRDEQFSQIPSEIALRICAIRETFEESGVLLVRSSTENKLGTQQSLWNGGTWASFFQDTATDSTMREWRQRVNEDPREFLYMCQELGVVPDVESLYEWADWLTPFQLSKRFDTVFFICCVQGKPHVAEDEQETVHSQWVSPYDILHQYYKGQVCLAPPQVYEMGRLMQFNTESELLQFAWQRGQHRVERWLPLGVVSSDHSGAVMPGDSLYPEDVNPEGPALVVTHEQTLAELDKSHPNKNRTIFVPHRLQPNGWRCVCVTCNIPLPGQHISPHFTDSDLLEDSFSSTSKL